MINRSIVSNPPSIDPSPPIQTQLVDPWWDMRERPCEALPIHDQQPISATTQPWPKHRTQPRPTTPLITGHSKKKKSQPPQWPTPKTTTTIDPCRHPRPKHRTHNPTTTQTLDPTTTNNLNTGPNREGRERRDGVWVWREERADEETKKEEREKNWSTEIVEREISGVE